MTKKHLVTTIGLICQAGKFCGFRTSRKGKQLSKLCGFQHFIEVAKEGRVYDLVFDTTHPEVYLNAAKKQEEASNDPKEAK